MEQILAEKLHSHLAKQHPDLLLRLQDKQNVTAYIKNKVASISGLSEELFEASYPAYIVEEQCFQRLVDDLGPSRYHYISDILQQDFRNTYDRLKETGVLTYEICNLIDTCEEAFAQFEFSHETEDTRSLLYVVTGMIAEYFEKPTGPAKETDNGL